jgi:hypothetical protein
LQSLLNLGTIANQGLPFYRGELVYKIPVQSKATASQRVFLETPKFGAACVRVTSSKGAIQVLGWKPYRADITGEMGTPSDPPAADAAALAEARLKRQLRPEPAAQLQAADRQLKPVRRRRPVVKGEEVRPKSPAPRTSLPPACLKRRSSQSCKLPLLNRRLHKLLAWIPRIICNLTSAESVLPAPSFTNSIRPPQCHQFFNDPHPSMSECALYCLRGLSARTI